MYPVLMISGDKLIQFNNSGRKQMSEQNTNYESDSNQINWKKTAFVSLLILLGGAAVTALIFMTEPTAERSGATRETAMHYCVFLRQGVELPLYRQRTLSIPGQ